MLYLPSTVDPQLESLGTHQRVGLYKQDPEAFVKKARDCTTFYCLGKWTPEIHYVTPQDARQEVRMLLLVLQRLHATGVLPQAFPNELLFILISELVGRGRWIL
jgi:hypothetical protein